MTKKEKETLELLKKVAEWYKDYSKQPGNKAVADIFWERGLGIEEAILTLTNENHRQLLEQIYGG